MSKLPIDYEVQVHKGAVTLFELAAAHRPTLLVGPPPEFGGTDTSWSPEHLLVAAAATCFGATYFALAERARLPIGRYDCRARGTLGKGADGVAFLGIRLDVSVEVVVGDVERARALIATAKRQCFVASSLRCPVEVEARVVAS